MIRKVIMAPMREGEGSKAGIIAVVLSVATLSIALLMFTVVFQPKISQPKISQSTITAVYAGGPTNVTGMWTCTNIFLQITNQADDNTFIYGKDRSIWSGAFEGISHDNFIQTSYPSGLITLKGQIDFNGEMKGKYGTLVILFLIKAEFHRALHISGQWSILSGMGDLANLRGEGSFRGWGGCLIYLGQIYFE